MLLCLVTEREGSGHCQAPRVVFAQCPFVPGEQARGGISENSIYQIPALSAIRHNTENLPRQLTSSLNKAAVEEALAYFQSAFRCSVGSL